MATNNRRNLIKTIALGSAAVLLSPVALASDKVVRLLIGYTPGGPADALARLIANKLKDSLNQTVIVENKGGMGGRLVLLEGKRVAPDGRTLIMTAGGVFTVQPWLYKNLGFDPFKDFTPIARVSSFDMAIVAGSKSPYGSNLESLLTWLKANPSRAYYGSPGAGTVPHFVGQLMANEVGLSLQHVPYKGSNPAMLDLISGQIPMVVDSPPIEMHRMGRVRILALTGNSRSKFLPDVPTMKELGYDVVADQFFALYGPNGMAPETVAHLSQLVAEALKDPEIQEKINVLGMSPAYLGPEETMALQKAEYKRWELPIKSSGYVPD
jgi:tripartite-type tricarboxylate transporter receptor subunit TctC